MTLSCISKCNLDAQKKIKSSILFRQLLECGFCPRAKPCHGHAGSCTVTRRKRTMAVQECSAGMQRVIETCIIIVMMMIIIITLLY